MKVFENISLKEYNTFGIDVKARRMVVVELEDSVECVVDSIRGQEVLVLGAGSNMVFTKDYDGTVITLARNSQFSILLPALQALSTDESKNITAKNYHFVSAWGGMVMDDLVQYTLDQGLYGLENLSAIPGTVGASAVQNVGAYGAEAKDFIDSVEAYDLQEHCRCTFSNADCQFAYRDSFFKHHPGRYLILRVVYRLNKEYTPNLSYKALEGLPHDTAQQLRDAITELRWSKLPRPEEHGSAGSFFKNPVVDEETYLRLKADNPDMPEAHPIFNFQFSIFNYKLSAGWLIDKAGWKGRTQGRAGVWPKNALVLYNTDGCSGEEVRSLATAIQQDVKQKFGVSLDPEAIMI